MAVVINSPANGASISGTRTVTATFSGPNFDIATVTLGGVQLASDSALPLSFSIDTTRVANGTHTLIVAVRYRTNGGKLRWQKASISVVVNNVAANPWVRVAGESQSFTLATNKEVRYGANTTFVSKVLGPGTYACDNATFTDPLVGTTKYCEARSTTSTPPPPPPPPPLPPNVALSNYTAVIT